MSNDHINAILLGKLGDVVLLSRLSRITPNSFGLITSPELTDIAAKIGKYTFVRSYTEYTDQSKYYVNHGTEYIDLHNKSERIGDYKTIFKNYSTVLSTTGDRAKWLGIPPLKLIQPRNHTADSLLNYWKRNLKIKIDIPQLLPVAEILARKHNITEPCKVLFSFQSSAKHKIISEENQKRLLKHFVQTVQNVGVLIGPGPNINIKHILECGANIIRVSTPDDIIEVFKQYCILISGDNGIRHLAGAYSIPRITIYGPTDPQICGSGSDEFSVVSDVQCAPCGAVEQCPKYTNPCCLKQDVLFDKVLDKWEEFTCAHCQT